MKIGKVFLVSLLCAGSACAVSAARAGSLTHPAPGPRLEVPASAPAGGMRADAGFAVGIDGGAGGAGTLTLSNFAEGLPFAVRGSLGYLSLDPGDAPLARQVFVNNATNGTPEKSGHRWDLRLDARYPMKGGKLKGGWFYLGPRLSMFRGTFNFVGGNETFDVVTNQVGAGMGIEEQYPIGPRTSLSIDAGADWYASADLSGHGSSYGPDGTLVDPKEDFSYADADKAIRQPRFAPRLTVGLQYRLGR